MRCAISTWRRSKSRPLVGKPWEYSFYIDFYGAEQEPVTGRALAHLAEYALTLRVLGSYPSHRDTGKRPDTAT